MHMKLVATLSLPAGFTVILRYPGTKLLSDTISKVFKMAHNTVEKLDHESYFIVNGFFDNGYLLQMK